MTRRALLAAAVVATASQVGAFAPMALRKGAGRASTSCVSMELDGMLSRRGALQTAAASVGGLVSLPVAPAFAARQTKQELLVQAAAIQKEVAGMVAGFELAEADWETKDKLEAQREYNVLQTVLRGGQLSQLRGTCFHLYRDHIVDSQKFKEAEKQYKEMLKTVETLNVLVLKASRAELKDEEIKTIKPAFTKFSKQLDAFVAVAGNA